MSRGWATDLQNCPVLRAERERERDGKKHHTTLPEIHIAPENVWLED